MAESFRRGSRSLIDRYSALVIALAAAMWAVDAFFRPSLVNPKGWDLSSSEIVLGESLLISLCFLPVAGRVVRELAPRLVAKLASPGGDRCRPSGFRHRPLHAVADLRL